MRLSFLLFLLTTLAAATTTRTTAFVVGSPHKKTLSSWGVSRTPIAITRIPSRAGLLYYSSSTDDPDDDEEACSSNPVKTNGGYLERVEVAFSKARARLENIKLELQQDRDESQRTLEAVQERMKNQESQLTDKLEYNNSDQVAAVKIDTIIIEEDTAHYTESKHELLPKELQVLIAQFENEQARMKQSNNNMLLEESSSMEVAQDQRLESTTTITTQQQTEEKYQGADDDKEQDNSDELRSLKP